MSIERYIESNFLTIAPDTLLLEAIALFAREQADYLVVQAELSGILTKDDVIEAISTEIDLETTTVNTVMTQLVITVTDRQCQDIQSVWSFLQQHSIDYLPILGKGGELVGVVNAKRCRKEQSWQRKAKELERFFNLTPSMLCIAGFNGYFRQINPAFSETLGFSEDELLAEPFIDFVHPEDRAATLAEVSKLSTGKITISFENRYRTKNGDYRWLLWTAKPYVSEKILYAAAQDITERKAAEQALKESEERWQLALRGANDGIWDWNVQTNEVFFSRRWKEMLGFEEDEISNTLEEWSKRVHPDDLGWVSEVIQEHFAGKTPFYVSEHRVLCKDGSYKWILDRGQALWDEERNVIRMAGSHTDIRDRRSAEEKLAKSENLLRIIVESEPECVKLIDRNGKLLEMNPAGLAIIEADSVTDMVGKNELKGLLVAHQCHNRRQWQESEIQLLKQLANQIGLALSQAQLLNNLEELVSQRTKQLTKTNQLLQIEIAEREQTEAALRENQQRLEGILDNANEAIISIDEQQQIQLFNQGTEKIFGYQTQEVMGKPLDILIPEAFRQVHRQHVDEFKASDRQSRKMAERSSNLYGRRQNGEVFLIEASVAKLQTKDGQIFTIMLKDITERRQAREKLQASQTMLAKAEKIAKIGSWEYNHETQQTTWSEELFSILGFDRDRLSSFQESLQSCQEIMERVHPEERLLVRNTMRQGHIEGIPWKFNYRWILPDGTLKYLESRGEPTVDRRGRVLKVLETIMDISDRISAEKSRQRSEEQLMLITDALPVLIAYIDRQQRYRYTNRTYETWFGKSRSGLLGQSMKELLGEDNYQKILPYVRTVLAGKAVTFENQLRTENGNAYWISATYIPDFDSDGRVMGFFAMVDDITERKAVEQMKSEFVSIASHEMRTPLTSIHGVIKLLSAGRLGEVSEPGKVMVDMALRNSARLMRLVEDLLNLERMESGKDKIEKQRCDSTELIQQAVDALHSMADEQQISLETDSQSIELYADRDRIVQTLTNLIGNAIKFSSKGDKVWVAAKLQDKNVLLAIEDRGRGVPQDKIETIFERYPIDIGYIKLAIFKLMIIGWVFNFFRHLTKNTTTLR